MSTCVKRSVLGAGDRQAAVKRAAAAVQAAALQATQRVQPHAGSPLGAPRGIGAAIPHSQLGGYNPMQEALRNISNTIGAFAQAVNKALEESAREAAEARASGANGKLTLRLLYQPYTEPMFIPWPSDEVAVAAVMCARATSSVTGEHLLNGSEIEYQFAGTQIQINSIDGMTPDATKPIAWVFIYFGIGV